MSQDKILQQAKKETEQSIALMRLMLRHRYKIWTAYAVALAALFWAVWALCAAAIGPPICTG